METNKERIEWFDDRVLTIVCLTLIAGLVIFANELSDAQVTIIVGIVSAIGGLTVGKKVGK